MLKLPYEGLIHKLNAKYQNTHNGKKSGKSLNRVILDMIYQHTGLSKYVQDFNGRL